MINIRTEVEAAEFRIRKYIRQTPLALSLSLSELTAANVRLKLENRQHTGSFKVRGALNKLLSLTDNEQRRGVVAASTGNHALAVAFGLEKLGMAGTVFVPENIAEAKRRKLQRYQVRLELRPGDPKAVETMAREYSVKHGLIYISPYNDPKIIGGQGTIAIELLREEPLTDCVFVSVGGGGLISGIAGYLKEADHNVRIIGCLPEQSAVMLESVKAGRIVETAVGDTLSDATAGGIEADAITFEPCSRFVDEWISVSESEIAAGLRRIFDDHGWVVEGSAGVVVASFLKRAKELRAQNVALVLCGGNIDRTRFKKLVF